MEHYISTSEGPEERKSLSGRPGPIAFPIGDRRTLWSGPYPAGTDGRFYIDGHYRPAHPGGIRSLSLSNHPPMDPFKAHLVALLSIYELGPFPGTPIPRYEGPTDWQTESILKSFGAMARRMCSAEETVNDFRKQLVNIPSILIL